MAIPNNLQAYNIISIRNAGGTRLKGGKIKEAGMSIP